MIDVRQLSLPGVLEIVPKRHCDARGFFCESYNQSALSRAGIELIFVQDNHAFCATKGVMRGLHYQLPPRAQDKLVRVIRGSILDVVVDIRRASPSFGEWLSLEISAEKGNQILVPKGFAHGLITLTPEAEVLYKVTDFYSAELDRSIRFDDPAIGMQWPSFDGEIQVSDKDRNAPLLAAAEIFP